MIISDLNLTKEGGTIRAEAQITWENADRPPFKLFVQTLQKYEDYLFPDPNSFLIASLMTAWYYGERRILVDGVLSPLLVHNLHGVFMLMKAWYPHDFNQQPKIEAKKLNAMVPCNKGAVSLLSGGIDSLALLRANKLYLPADHSDAIKAVLSIGYLPSCASNETELLEPLKGRLHSTTAVTDDADVMVIPVVTNTWWLNPDGYFFGQKSYGSQLISIASFFSRGFHKGFIASSYDASYLHKPWGSHPQLDSYYSSSHFAIQHLGTEMTRLQKVALVADWPAAYHNLRVCQNDNTGSSNCGTCEKCIRTMLMLEALGKLKDCRAFPENTIDSQRLRYLDTYDMLHCTDRVHDEEKIYLYNQIIPPLTERKRFDLVETLEKILRTLHEKQQAACGERAS